MSMHKLEIAGLSCDSGQMNIDRGSHEQCITPSPALFIGISHAGICRMVHNPVYSFLHSMKHRIFFITIVHTQIKLSYA